MLLSQSVSLLCMNDMKEMGGEAAQMKFRLKLDFNHADEVFCHAHIGFS